MSILMFIFAVIITFVSGYYLGHQMGSTAHIRAHLAAQRERRQ